MILLAYGVFALIVSIDLYTDYVLIEKKGISPNHTIGAILRVGALVIPSLMAGGFHTWSFLAWLFHFAALFWLVFDILLNDLRKRELWYVGYTAKIDLFFRALFDKPERAMLITKLVLIIVSILWLILQRSQ